MTDDNNEIIIIAKINFRLNYEVNYRAVHIGKGIYCTL